MLLGEKSDPEQEKEVLHIRAKSECRAKLQLQNRPHRPRPHAHKEIGCSGRSLYSLFMDSFHEHKKERRRIVVLVDNDASVARTALAWAMLNVVCSGDIITLLHVHPTSSSSGRHSSWIAISLSKFPNLSTVPISKPSGGTSSKVIQEAARLLRLKGFQLALSLKDICDINHGANVEIVVVEGERGPTVVSFAKKLGASALILGQQKRCLLSRMLRKENASDYCIKNSECLVLAVEHKPTKREISGYRNTVSKVRIVRCV